MLANFIRFLEIRRLSRIIASARQVGAASSGFRRSALQHAHRITHILTLLDIASIGSEVPTLFYEAFNLLICRSSSWTFAAIPKTQR